MFCHFHPPLTGLIWVMGRTKFFYGISRINLRWSLLTNNECSKNFEIDIQADRQSGKYGLCRTIESFTMFQCCYSACRILYTSLKCISLENFTFNPLLPKCPLSSTRKYFSCSVRMNEIHFMWSLELEWWQQFYPQISSWTSKNQQTIQGEVSISPRTGSVQTLVCPSIWQQWKKCYKCIS